VRKEYHKLLDQIIENAEIMDKREKGESMKTHKGDQAIGESWMVHHLKLLKELSEE